MQAYIVNAQFIKNDAYKRVLWTLLAIMLGVSFVMYLMSNNMLLSVFGFVTMLIAALALLIFMRDRYTLDIEALRTPDKKFEVLVKGADMHIVNPQTVYFGVNEDKDGQKYINLGIPNGTSLLVLRENIKQSDVFKDVGAFLVPRDFLGQDIFESKSKKSSDLTQLAKVFGFI